MIQVKKGNHCLTVTRGAFENFYKQLGYELVGVDESHENSGQEFTHQQEDSQQPGNPTQQETDEEDSVEPEDGDEEQDDDENDIDLSEIPLGELSHSQLFEYADQLGLEYEGTPGAEALRALIRKHLT